MTAGANPVITARFVGVPLLPDLLAGLRVLVLEDEFLIAMDVEQICRDHGAADVRIVRSLSEVEDDRPVPDCDAAILDVMLAGQSTLDFADRLAQAGLPFIFASGYAESRDIAVRFPGVDIVGKPYSGDDLVQALARACLRSESDGL